MDVCYDMLFHVSNAFVNVLDKLLFLLGNISKPKFCAPFSNEKIENGMG